VGLECHCVGLECHGSNANLLYLLDCAKKRKKLTMQWVA
jgi:hypothetical protein